MVYEYSGRYETAAEYNLKAARIKDQLNDVVRRISAKNSLGDIYRHLEKDDKALEYFNLALKENDECQNL